MIQRYGDFTNPTSLLTIYSQIKNPQPCEHVEGQLVI